MTTLACEGPGNTPEPSQLAGYRADSSAHKVQVSAAQALQLEKSGANVQLIGDYGSFKLLAVDEEALKSLPEGANVELRDSYNDILLNAGTINTASEHGKSLRGMSKLSAGKGLHIVQFAGPVKPEWYRELEATGVRIISYIPNNAYIVYGDGAALNRLQKHVEAVPTIQWNGDYLNDYKLDPSIHRLETETYSIQLIKDEEANRPTLNLIGRLQSRDGTIEESLGYVNVVAYLTVKDLYEVATRPDVLSIQPRPEMKKVDERQNMIVSGHLSGNKPTGPGYLAWLASKGFTQAQFTASGFGVDVSDSGLDNAIPGTPNHFGLYEGGNVNAASRVVYARLEGSANSGSTIQGCDGHGTLNAHIVGGYVNLTGAPFTDETGFTHGLGVAPFVKLGSSVVFDPNTFTSPDYEDLQSRAYNDGMRISSNSWGARLNTYTADAQRYDALVRDAQPLGSAQPNPGNQEMVILFAAGNSGSGANTVGSPGTAKNIITVGASENVRAFGGDDLCGTGDDDADSLNDIVGFSSRGPTSDGRKKPDIVAPGTHVSGGVAQVEGQRATVPEFPLGKALSCFNAEGVCGGPDDNFYPVGQQWYSASSGTSHSTPAVAGGAALVRQYFINQGVTPPSAAMTKAYLMNSARYMTGVGANDNLFSNNQGMGLMDLGLAFDGSPRLLDDQTGSQTFTATGQTRTFAGVVSDPSKPFRVTLAWTDAPGSTTGSAWKNNLDLSVTAGGQTYKGNVFTKAFSTTGGTADDKNNVESVFLPAGTEGGYTVTVTATNINSDGVPGNEAALDQDFALVVYNTCSAAATTPTGVSGAVNGDNRIDLSWESTGASSYRVYRATTAGGPYTRVADVGTTSYEDKGVSGGTTYYYVIRGVECAESGNSTEVSVTATGLCTLPPTFAGVASVTNAAAATCGATVSWNAATPICGGTVSYSVYRSLTPGFTPSKANRIITGVTGTSFSDDLNLANNTKYYYVVRATEVSNATNEEQNTVEKATVATGVITPEGPGFYDDFDGSRPENASAYWIPTTLSGAPGTMNIVSNCRYQSATNAYRIGAANSDCGGTYPTSLQAILALGGNGSTPGINGLTLPPSSLQPRMTFNVWYNMENRYDGVYLVYSTTSASGPWLNVGDTVSTTAPYISAGGYDNTLSSDTTIRIWTNLRSESNGALKAVTVNLDALASQTVWFGFRAHTDNLVNREGFYVDNVRIPTVSIASCSTHTPPPGPAVGYTVTGLPAFVGAGDATTFTVTAVDAVGVTATGYNGTASFTSSDAQATLPANASFTEGVASDVSITFRTLGPQTVTATDIGNAQVKGSGSTSITAGDPVALTFTAQPSTVAAGASITPAVKVGMVDQFGNAVTRGTNSITVKLGANPAGGTLSGATTVSAVNGVATFSNLWLNKVGTGYTLIASSADLLGATSSAFNVTPAAASKLVFSTQPVNGTVGILPAVKVSILDRFDNQTASTANVVVSLGANPAGGALTGTTTVAAVAGVATFSNLEIGKAGAGYSLAAASGTLTKATSSTFNLVAGAPFRASFTQQPTDTPEGSAISPAVKVTLFDKYANVATGASTPVTVALLSNPTSARLRGTITVNAAAGVATFSDLEVSRAGRNYTLVAGASGIYSDSSLGFDVSQGSQGSVPKLVFRSSPGNVAAGASLPEIKVELQDAQGRIVTDETRLVTLSLGSNMEGGQLLGTTMMATVDGVATFSGLSVRKVGPVYTLEANAEGYEAAASAAFAVAPGAAARYSLTLPASVPVGEEVTLSASAFDAYGNLAVNYAGSAKLTSTDTQAALPGSVVFAEGVANNIKVTFKTTGLKTLILADTQLTSLSSSVKTNVTSTARPDAPGDGDGDDNGGGDGCSATSGTGASASLGLLVLAKYLLGRRRREQAAA